MDYYGDDAARTRFATTFALPWRRLGLGFGRTHWGRPNDCGSAADREGLV